jgi:DNA repair protein RecO (recombination protein O)
MRINFQPAFVLHSRAYRDTSLLVELFTEQHGRVSAVARGVRTVKSKSKGLLLPFTPLAVCWSGKSTLMSLGKVEANGSGYNLSGHNLLSGFYLNELLLKLFQHNDPHPLVFQAYQTALAKLKNGDDLQLVLRLFEKQLLKELGFGMLFNIDSSGEKINTNANYYYQHERGLEISSSANSISGKSLLALHNEELTDPIVLAEAKKLMRQIFDHLLDGKELKTRKFFTDLY